MPKVTYLPHAEDQIAERTLPRDLVVLTVPEPEGTVAAGKRQVRQRVFRIDDKEYMIRAVCEQTEGKVVVVTVYRPSKIAKYRGLR